MIDVDALCDKGTAAPSLGTGKGVAKVARLENFIDVDEPSSLATPQSSRVGGSSSSGRVQPMLKFDGALGVALFQQKMEVMAEEGEAKVGGVARDTQAEPSNTSAPIDEAARPSGAGVGGDGIPVGEAAPAVEAEKGVGTMRGSSSTGGDVAISGAAAAGGDDAVVVAASAPAAVAMVVVKKAGGTGVAVQRPSARSKAVLSSLSRRHHTGKFVRRAPRMTVVPVPRMMAEAWTPPQSSSESDAHFVRSSDEIEEVFDGGAAAGADETQGAGQAMDDFASSAGDDAKGSAAPPAAGEPSAAAAGATPPVGTSAGSGALADQLAARSRNPRIFTAAFWQPNALAVLAAVQQPRAGLPPIVPPVARRAASIGAAARSAAPPIAPLPSPPPVSETPMADPTDDSSEEMDDDALFTAYITPPASPQPLSRAASPQQSRPSSGQRRRANDSRAVRAAAAAASSSVGVDTDMPPFSLRDVHAAIRSGFSSLPREVTRLRVEVVVTKSQSASTLRRMDRIAAAVDERESGNGIMLERLAALDRAVQGLSARMTTTSGGTTGDNASSGDSVALVAEIKVCTSFTLFRILRTDVRPSAQMQHVWCDVVWSHWLPTDVRALLIVCQL